MAESHQCVPGIVDCKTCDKVLHYFHDIIQHLQTQRNTNSGSNLNSSNKKEIRSISNIPKDLRITQNIILEVPKSYQIKANELLRLLIKSDLIYWDSKCGR